MIVHGSQDRLLSTKPRITAREYYAALREKGVDAVLTASAWMAKDGKPDNASAQVLDTASGDSLMDIAWQNGWGGYGGSRHAKKHF